MSDSDSDPDLQFDVDDNIVEEADDDGQVDDDGEPVGHDEGEVIEDGKFEANVTYVIIECEESFFLGLVREFVNKILKESCMQPVFCNGKKFTRSGPK